MTGDPPVRDTERRAVAMTGRRSLAAGRYSRS